MPKSYRYIFTFAFSLLACGGATSLDAGDGGVATVTQDDGGAASVGQCSWPASFDAPDASCSAARLWVSCTFASGGGCGCVSDDALECPGCAPSNGATCYDGCGADQYVVSCGGIGPASGSTDSPLPAGCQFEGAVPAGIAYYCCPCQ